MDKEKRRSFWWLAKFWGALLLFYWLHGTRWVENAVLQPIAVATAIAARKVLPRIGMEVEGAGVTIRAGESVFDVAGSCTGTLVIFLFAAAVLIFPTSWKSRLKGLLVGLVGISILNFLRTILIVMVTTQFPQTFWMLHIVIGQAVVIVGAVGIFFWWIGKKNEAAFLPGRGREAVKTTAFFLFGFVAGYTAYYFLFLRSPLGEYSRELIGKHSASLLGLIFNVSYQGRVLGLPGAAIELAPECLASPLVVLFTAVVSALPIKWWKKLLAAVLGFWPIYYLYHLFATVLTVSSSTGGGPVNRSFIYVHMQQLVLAPALLALAAYYDWGAGNSKRCKRHFFILVGLSFAAIPLSILLGELYREFFMPGVAKLVSGSPELFLVNYMPQSSQIFSINRILRSMFDFEICLWFLLVGADPMYSWKWRISYAAAGLPIFLMHCFAVVSFIELFRLIPNVFLLQTWIILAPFAIFYAGKKLIKIIDKKEVTYGGMHLLQNH